MHLPYTHITKIQIGTNTDETTSICEKEPSNAQIL